MSLFRKKRDPKAKTVYTEPEWTKEEMDQVIQERYERMVRKYKPPLTKPQLIVNVIYLILGSLILIITLGFIGDMLKNPTGGSYTSCRLFLGCEK